jgi:FtsZ-interacting cell division protein ZipA
VRKLLIAVSVVSALALVADEAAARPLGVRASRSAPQPAAVQNYHRRDANAAKARESSPPPRSWTVAVPTRTARSHPNRAADEAYAAVPAAADSSAPFAAASAPSEATKTEPVTKSPEPQEPVRMVVLNPDAPHKQAPAGPKQPHNFAICYWNQAGRCLER